jgi:hypothetical protein
MAILTEERSSVQAARTIADAAAQALGIDVERAGTVVREAVEDGRRVARRALKDGRMAAEDVLDGAVLQVRRHPLRSVAIVFAGGAALGLAIGYAAAVACRRART